MSCWSLTDLIAPVWVFLAGLSWRNSLRVQSECDPAMNQEMAASVGRATGTG